MHLGTSCGFIVAAAFVGYALGPAVETDSPASTNRHESWSPLPNLRIATRISIPSLSDAIQWPGLRSIIAQASTAAAPDLLEEIWSRLPETERETWLKSLLVQWVNLDPPAAVSQIRHWGNDTPLGRWLEREGLSFAMDRWARADPPAAVAYHLENKLLNTQFGTALFDANPDDLVQWLTKHSSLLGYQSSLWRSLAKRHRDIAFAILRDMDARDHLRSKLATHLAEIDLERTIDTLRLSTTHPSDLHYFYALWAAQDFKAATKHLEAAFPGEKPLIGMIAANHKNQGLGSFLNTIKSYKITNPNLHLLFRGCASAMAYPEDSIESFIAQIQPLVPEDYDPLNEWSRFHDPILSLKHALNENHWPPRGQEQAVFNHLLDLPQGTIRDAMLGAAVAQVANADLERAVNLAVTAADHGALWVSEGIAPKLHGNFDLQLRMARSIRGSELRNFRSVADLDVGEDPARLADAIAASEEHPSSPSLTWHLMQSWGHIDLESAKHWLSQRSPLIQDWGTSSLSLSQDMSSGDFQTAARQLLSVQVPFPEHDEHLRHALRIWGRRSDNEDNEAVTAIRQASHLSVDYQEKLINYVLHRQRYTFP